MQAHPDTADRDLWPAGITDSNGKTSRIAKPAKYLHRLHTPCFLLIARIIADPFEKFKKCEAGLTEIHISGILD